MPWNFVAGWYAATIANKALGATQDGFRTSRSDFKEDITVDEYGDMPVDAVYRGAAMRLQFRLAEWNAAGRDEILHFYDDTVGKVEKVGKLLVGNSLVKQLVLTPQLSGTGQFTYTFPRIAPDGDRSWNKNNRLRVVEVSVMAYPDDNGVLFTRS